MGGGGEVRGGGGGRGGGGPSCVLLTAKGDWAWNEYFFRFVYVVFYCQRGEWDRNNYFCFMEGGMREKETDQYFLFRVVL